jgi:lysozyme
MRHITPQGLSFIQHFEGFSPVVYHDAAGLPTIGYGHLLKPGEAFAEISEAQARQLLAQDVQVAERAVLRLIQVPLHDGQFDALVSFTFNLGAGALQRSTLRRKINRNEHTEVPSELLKWVWAGGRRLPGLVRRRKAEGEMYSG